MKNIEKRKGRKYCNKDFNFVRSGKTGYGKTEIPNNELNHFIENNLCESVILDNLYL